MQVELKNKEFSRACGIASVCSDRAIVRAISDQIVISAQCAHYSIAHTIDVTSASDGLVAVSSKTIRDIASIMPMTSTVKLSLDDNAMLLFLSFSGVKTKYKLATLPTYDVDLNAVKCDYKRLTTGELWSMLDKTIYAIDHKHPALDAVLIERIGDAIISTSTDGKRLARFTSGAKDILDDGARVTINKDTASTIKAILGKLDADDLVQFGLTPNGQIVVDTGDTKIVACQSGDAKAYPDTSGLVIADDTAQEILIDKATVLEAIKRSSTIADKESGKISLKVRGGKITIGAESESGEYSETIDAINSNARIDLLVNQGYLSDAIRSIDDDSVFIVAKDNTSGLIIFGEKDQSQTCVVMPMRK